MTRATLDETLAAIRKASGAEISGAGPVRVVSTARLAARSDAPAGGAPASFALKRVEVRDLLAGMADVDPGLAALGPPGFLGRVSVWTKDAPLSRFARPSWTRPGSRSAPRMNAASSSAARARARRPSPSPAPGRSPASRSGAKSSRSRSSSWRA